MEGPSRSSLADASARLYARAADDVAGAGGLGSELLSVARLLGQQLELRRLLADAGTPAQTRSELVTSLLGGKVSQGALDVLTQVAEARWSSAPDLVDAVERLGAMALFVEAEQAGRLDSVEDELYRLARIVAADDRLRSALSATWLPLERKVAVVRDLLASRVDPTTLALVEHVLASPRGRPVDSALEVFAVQAGARYGRVYAQAFAAVPLDEAQVLRLESALARIYGRDAKVSVVIDPSVIGGVRLVVGDEVIDGSVAHRLEQARSSLEL